LAAELDGPRIESRSREPASQLVVFLHGYGADGNDLIEIGRIWQDLLPQAAFVSPHAPNPCGQAPMGREWFPLTFRNPDERWNGVNAAAPVLQQFLDAELARQADLIAQKKREAESVNAKYDADKQRWRELVAAKAVP